MRIVRFVLVLTLLAVPVAFAASADTYVGIITDTMCGTNHAAMKVTPDAKCVKECVSHGNTYKYALIVGSNVYALSDQDTPAKFAGQKVKVTGVLYEKTRILKVDSIATAR